LLRSHTKDEARLVYGMAVPFNAPFVGGGILSLTLPEWTARGGETIIPFLLLAWMFVFFVVCRRLQQKEAHE
ncbi:MAG TPA: hypothetical protein PLB73_10275, partial [Leptospiraceae bacterium]|nr:hypothetical protein [Leptospiraceae bacterium]